MTFKISVLLSLALLSGCGFIFGGGKEIRQPMETEDERIERLATQVSLLLELKRPAVKIEVHDTVRIAAASAPMLPGKQIPKRRPFGIEESFKASRFVTFTADSITVVRFDVGQFGRLTKEGDSWKLKVYANYDFDEVVNYLKHFE